MSKGTLTAQTRQQLLVDDFDISVSCSHLELCLVHFYENSVDSGTRRRLVNAFWSLVSASLSITLMLVSSSCKQVATFSAETVTTVVVVILLFLVVAAIIIGILLSTKSFKDSRDTLIKTTMKEISKGRKQKDYNECDVFKFE